jgi:hypothetical protein
MSEAEEFISNGPMEQDEDLPDIEACHGLEGSGKTSLAAHKPNPVFICSSGETGIQTLKKYKRCPNTVKAFPECEEWNHVRAHLNWLASKVHNFENVILDTGNGLEAMLTQDTLINEFSGDQDKFDQFGRGARRVIQRWREFATNLRFLRARRNMGVTILLHSAKVPFENPTDADYYRWEPAMSTKYKKETTWGIVNGLADMVLFLSFEDGIYKPKSGNGKAITDVGGTLKRVVYTERRPAFDAKNRHGLPPKIVLPCDPSKAWETIIGHFTK